MLRTGPRRALLYKRPAAVSTWTPLLASTAAVWWVDANNSGSITSVGGFGTAVTQWNDLGTGSHNMTPSGTGPTYTSNVQNGKPGMDFSGGLGIRTASFFVNQPFMLVVVWKQSGTAPADYGILWQGDRDESIGGRALIQTKNVDNSNSYNINAGTVVNQSVTISTGQAYHSRAVFNNTSSSSVLNASSLTGQTAGIGGVEGGIALSGIASSAVYSNAIICEAFIIPNSTGDDATNAAAYTLAKWGI